VLDDLLRERTVARGLAIGRLAADWTSVVGDRLASETAPASLERGVLTVAATDGPWGAQARFLADEILRQANAALGRPLVTSVRVVVRPARPRGL
jgi:predicted nucleic acid-binding Zn ribbon protein